MKYETTNLDAVAAMEAYAVIERGLQAILNRTVAVTEGEIGPAQALNEIAAIGQQLGYAIVPSNTGDNVILEPGWVRRTLGRGKRQAGWQGSEGWYDFIQLEADRADAAIDDMAATVGDLQDKIVPKALAPVKPTE